MKLTILVTYILLGYFKNVLVEGSSSFQNPSLCVGNRTHPVSCSEQLAGDEDQDACLVYPTDLCKDHESSEKRVFYLESHTTFAFMLFPYKYIGNYSTTHWAFNISLKTSNPEISKFLFRLSQDFNNSPYRTCRLFDFSKAKRNFRGESGNDISLYYDCYKELEEPSLLYNVIVNAIPTNEEIHYKVLFPPLVIDEKNDLCKWSPLKMVNMEALKRNIVELKFSVAPQPITSYVIQLSSSDGKSPNLTSYVSYERQSEWHTVLFENVPNGKYTVFVVPILLDNSTNKCKPIDRLHILVIDDENFNHQLLFVVIICCSLVGVVLLGYVTHKLCHRIGLQDSTMLEMPKPKVLILYSFDCTQHMDVVHKFAEYLKSYCNMEVMLDVLDMGNKQPVATWLSETISASQFVVVVISRGVHHKAEGKNKPPMNEGNPHGDLFVPALNLLMNKVASCKIDNENSHNAQLGNDAPDVPPFQVIKVRFEYSSWRHVPSALFKIGPSFFLMNQLNEFLCQIHCQQSKVFPIKIYPKMPGSDFMSNNKGKELLNAVDNMKAFQKENPLWFNLACKPLHGSIENDESSNTTSEQIKLTKCEDDMALADDTKIMIQLNVTNNSRKPSPSNSGKSVKISLDGEKIPETEELLEREIRDEKV